MTDSDVPRSEDPFSPGLGGLLLIYPRLSLSLAARAFMRLLKRRYAAAQLAKLPAHPPASASSSLGRAGLLWQEPRGDRHVPKGFRGSHRPVCFQTCETEHSEVVLRKFSGIVNNLVTTIA